MCKLLKLQVLTPRLEFVMRVLEQQAAEQRPVPAGAGPRPREPRAAAGARAAAALQPGARPAPLRHQQQQRQEEPRPHPLPHEECPDRGRQGGSGRGSEMKCRNIIVMKEVVITCDTYPGDLISIY